MRPYNKINAGFRIKINRGNAAFVDSPEETQRIIKEFFASFRYLNAAKGDVFKLFDINGNCVGTATHLL